MTALLKKPFGFKGSPLFADDRSIDPIVHKDCSIEPDMTDPKQELYKLKISDFSKCGVIKRNVKKCKIKLHAFKITILFGFFLFLIQGICSRKNMVSSISWCGHAIGSRINNNV